MASNKLSLSAIIIASYTAVSLLLGTFSFGLIQVRIAELMLVMCLADKSFIIPITLGCFVTNLIGILSGVNPMVLDLLVGSLATFLSGVCVYMFKDIKLFNKPILSLLMPVIINGVMVGLELSIYLNIDVMLTIAYVAMGEFISVTILGYILYEPIVKAIKVYLK